MTVESAVDFGREALLLTLLIGAPVMVVAVVVGLLISVLQAVTQLQDQTLSFVPKIIAMLLTLLYVLPWVATRMMNYATDLVTGIPASL